MQVEVVRPADLGPGELERWRALQVDDASLGSPFLSPEFAQAAERARPATRVAVISAAGATVGFLAFEQTGRRSAQALGLGLSDVQGLVAPAHATLSLPAIVRACGLALWRFDHLVGHQRRWIPDHRARLIEETSPAVDLCGGWDAFHASLRRRSTFQGASRKRRKLAREHDDVGLSFHAGDHALLDWLMRRKSEQYARTGAADVLADPRHRRLLHELLDVDAPGCAGRLTVLSAGETPVAAHFGLAGHGQLAWWFPTYDAAFGAYSPGLVLILELVRAMAGHGLTLLDLGKGDAPYKQRLANTELPLLRGAVANRPLRVAAERVARWPRERLVPLLGRDPRVRRLLRGTVRRR